MKHFLKLKTSPPKAGKLELSSVNPSRSIGFVRPRRTNPTRCECIRNRTLKGNKMLGNFNGKLDKNTCLVCLGIISAVMFTIISQDLFSVFDISGVFKQ